MWQPTDPISFLDRELAGLDAWVHVFAVTWEQLETDPEDLCTAGVSAFARAVAQKHCDEDPAAVAWRLYPETGEFFKDVYPAFAQTTPAGFIALDDVPF